MTEIELLIRGGRVVDGTGSPAVRADVAIAGDRIVAVGELGARAGRVIDADGQVVAPGFIDVHTHYDAQVFWDPTLSPSSNHGVTSVLGGNCGFSIAPLGDRAEDRDYLVGMLARVEGMPLASLRASVPLDWRGFGEYLDRLDGTLAINAGFLVGHSALRRAVMGRRALSAATPAEIEAMGALLRRSLEEGGLGFSSSLSRSHNDPQGQPVPSRHASREELLSLCRVTGEVEGTFLEFVPAAPTEFDSETVGQMTEMSLAAGRPLNWNVLLPLSEAPHIYRSQLAASDTAAARGARIIPLAAAQPLTGVLNLAGGMTFDSFPGWAEVMALPRAERMHALADPEVRRRLDAGLRSEAAGYFRAFSDWSTWRIVETRRPEHKALEGRLVGELARRTGKPPLDALLDLAIAEDLETRVSPPPPGDDPESWRLRGEAWLDPRTLIGGSDAGAHLDMIDSFAFTSQVLSEGVRKRGLLSLEQAVHQLTDLPARRFGIKERGRVAVGGYADLVVFDPARIGCGPLQTRHDLPAGGCRLYAEPLGVSHVVVNGRPIHQHNRFTGAFPGTVLRSGRDTVSVA
jgi:N-acyl-D-aspartate/D-glutamate deacylase